MRQKTSVIQILKSAPWVPTLGMPLIKPTRRLNAILILPPYERGHLWRCILTKTEAEQISEYVIALEAAAVTYAEKYGISEAFLYALSCKPSEDVFTLLYAALKGRGA
jgi:hypothetical protein